MKKVKFILDKGVNFLHPHPIISYLCKGDSSNAGPRGGRCPLGVGGGVLGLQISSKALAVSGVGVAPAHNLWGSNLER